MGFLNTNSTPHLVEKLSDGNNIKITGNSKGDKVGTVVKKIVEKADDVTKAIEQEVVNDGYSFKVGTGDVDVSEDVEDGFGEIGIKGVTYQNCLNFTDDITFNLNLEYWNIRTIPSDKILVKPNTVYTMIIYVSNVTVSHKELLWIGDVSGNKNAITDEIIRKNVTMGINTFKFTTNSNPKDKAIRFQGSKFVEGVLTFKPLLLEGDHTNNPNLPSYFEGIVGIGDKIEILSSGKNIFDKSTITILLDEPLMRLPNGVCDEITRDGKLIRRVGKIVFNGSENWNAIGYGGHSTRNTFETSIIIEPIGTATKAVNSFCDRFIYDATTQLPKEDNHYRVSHTENANGNKCYFLFCPDVNTVPYRNVTSWKQWLSQNPTTVYYELAKPIVTEIPAPYLRIFKDGHLTFNTLVAPESTHVVQLNKSSQIERSIREVQSLDSRVGKLESFYDDMMLETSHKLNLLTYDFEYTREE